FTSRRRHTRSRRDWSSDVCSSDLILLVSQFTLYGDVRKGNRPSFTESAGLKKANDYYERLRDELIDEGFNVKTGKFQAYMQVSLVNDGPVTIILDSERIV